MNYWLFLIPLFSAFTGWLVIRLAIYFLFHPAKSKNIAGLNLHGIIPASQKKIAEAAGNAAASFLPMDKLEEKISSPAALQKILPMIELHIEDFLRNRLTKELPMIGMFVGDKTIGKVKEAFMKEIELLFPDIMKAYASNMKQDFDIRKKLTTTIANFPPSLAEKMLYKAAGRQLKWATLAGAAIGLLIGLAELGLLLLL